MHAWGDPAGGWTIAGRHPTHIEPAPGPADYVPLTTPAGPSHGHAAVFGTEPRFLDAVFVSAEEPAEIATGTSVSSIVAARAPIRSEKTASTDVRQRVHTTQSGAAVASAESRHFESKTVTYVSESTKTITNASVSVSDSTSRVSTARSGTESLLVRSQSQRTGASTTSRVAPQPEVPSVTASAASPSIHVDAHKAVSDGNTGEAEVS